MCRCCFYIWGWIYFNNSSFHISVYGKRSQFSATQFHISSTQCGDQCWILQSKLCYSALWLKNCESRLRFLKKQTAQKATKTRYNCVNQLVIRDLLKQMHKPESYFWLPSFSSWVSSKFSWIIQHLRTRARLIHWL